MIRYALTCDHNHAFESWFQSAEAFEKLRGSGLVNCPDCGSTQVNKALMAPGVQTARAQEARREQAARPLSTPADPRQEALAELRRQVESNSEYVGMSFASEARAMHDGDAPERAIWGEARADEAKALIEDGIPVMPLPFRGGGGKSN